MTEIFENIPVSVKTDVATVFEIALMQHDIVRAAKMLNEYVNSCQNAEEQEFANFYFQMKFEELNNENSND